MPKLVLQFEERVLKECAVSAAITIGRLPDNAVVIDNPAVSGRHARVVRNGADVLVEDLESRNGTFVNDARVTRHALRHGDVILIGKHKLVYDHTHDAPAAPDAAAPAMPDLGGTVVLDTEQQRKLLAAVNAQIRAQGESGDGDGTPRPSLGVLRVLAGRADRPEYKLEGHTSLIGASDAALVRLRGWFKPKRAVAIGRLGEGYVATLLGGRTFVNGQRLTSRRGLQHGDVLKVGGLTLEFRSET